MSIMQDLSTVLPGNCQCEACNSINCNSVRRMAGAESLAFKKASRIIESTMSLPQLITTALIECLGLVITIEIFGTRGYAMRYHSRFKERMILRFTSDKDLTGGFTQSSQHLESKVSSTRGGGAPSHWVRNCNCRRFNWQNISVRNAINAVKRAREGDFIP
uniref:Uncharacterized protein n=1 Tax=Glossina palpalis gambiensis TaxID=67801 RepID=A0A1B0BLS3_9MUSC